MFLIMQNFQALSKQTNNHLETKPLHAVHNHLDCMKKVTIIVSFYNVIIICH
jgi:hypothetical protein